MVGIGVGWPCFWKVGDEVDDLDSRVSQLSIIIYHTSRELHPLRTSETHSHSSYSN
jgi:hypothetical protein